MEITLVGPIAPADSSIARIGRTFPDGKGVGDPTALGDAGARGVVLASEVVTTRVPVSDVDAANDVVDLDGDAGASGPVGDCNTLGMFEAVPVGSEVAPPTVGPGDGSIVAAGKPDDELVP